MQESIQPRRETFAPALGGLDDVAGMPEAGGMAVVGHGVHGESLPVAGMSVGEIRRRYADRFDIHPRARAEVDGRDAGDETILRAGQMLLFASRSGEKGCSRPGGGR